MAQYRTAQGKVLDMSMFAAQHEKVRAVGNMRVNARGDTIDSDGKVVQSVNDKINEYYNSTVENPGSMAAIPASRVSRAVEKPTVAKSSVSTSQPKIDTSELSEAERDLQESLEESLEEEVKVEKSKTKK